MAYRTLTPEEREGIKQRLQAKKVPDDVEDLKKQLKNMMLERDDWKWAYQLTEGILKNDPKWYGVNERFSNRDSIEAAKIAKEMMGIRKTPPHVNQAIQPVPYRDTYKELIDWLKEKPWRRVTNDGRGWIVRDEAMSREIRHASIDDLLKTEGWDKFRKGL